MKDGGPTKAIDHLAKAQEKDEYEDSFLYKPVGKPIDELIKLAAPLCKGTIGLDRALLLRCSGAQMGSTRAALQAFDYVDQDTIIVKASIIEYQSDNANNAGIYGAISIMDGQLGLSFGDASAVSGSVLTLKTGNMTAAISAIGTNSHFDILNTSTLRIANGQQGRLQVGQDIPILGAAVVDATGRAAQSIQYRSTGLILEVKPKITGDRISADLTQQNRPSPPLSHPPSTARHS